MWIASTLLSLAISSAASIGLDESSAGTEPQTDEQSPDELAPTDPEAPEAVAPLPAGESAPKRGKIIKRRAPKKKAEPKGKSSEGLSTFDMLFPIGLSSPYHDSVGTGPVVLIWVANLAGLFTVSVPLGFLVPAIFDSPGGEYWTDAAIIVIGHGLISAASLLLLPFGYVCPPLLFGIGIFNWARVLWFLPMGLVNTWDHHLKARDGAVRDDGDGDGDGELQRRKREILDKSAGLDEEDVQALPGVAGLAGLSPDAVAY